MLQFLSQNLNVGLCINSALNSTELATIGKSKTGHRFTRNFHHLGKSHHQGDAVLQVVSELPTEHTCVNLHRVCLHSIFRCQHMTFWWSCAYALLC